MKIQTHVLILAAALAVAGCSSVKTSVDTGPIHAKTFSFINTATKELPSYASRGAQAHVMIQNAITTELDAKGVKYVDRGGDIIVAYLVIVGNNATTTSLNEYFGYTSDTLALVEKAHNEQAAKGGDQGFFEAGTLVIDVLDSNGSKLLKRGTVHSPILRDISAEARQERIQRLVDQAIASLQISP